MSVFSREFLIRASNRLSVFGGRLYLMFTPILSRVPGMRLLLQGDAPCKGGSPVRRRVSCIGPMGIHAVVASVALTNSWNEAATY